MIALMLTACGDKPSSVDVPPTKAALTVTVTTPLLRDSFIEASLKQGV